MEMTEGKAEDLKWEFWARGEATKACTMRLAKPWFGSGRVVAGDSWFASVQTAVALAANGLHFIGNVKTATKGFPKKWLSQKLKDSDRGTSIYAKATGFYICL